MFSKTTGKGSFFKRGSSWKEKHSKQKYQSSESTLKEDRLHRTTSFNDVAFLGANCSREEDASAVVDLSFGKIQINDGKSLRPDVEYPNSHIDCFDRSNRHQPLRGNRYGVGDASRIDKSFSNPGITDKNPLNISTKSRNERKTGTNMFSGRSIPRPTFKSHIEDVQNKYDHTDVRNTEQCQAKTPQKRSVSSKARIDCRKTPTNQFSYASPADGSNRSKNRISTRVSTDNVKEPSLQQPNSLNVCVTCHGPLQTSKNAERLNLIKRPVSVRNSTGNVIKTSQKKPDSLNFCISCNVPLETNSFSLAYQGDGSNLKKDRNSVKLSNVDETKSPPNQPRTASITHSTPSTSKGPDEERSNPRRHSLPETIDDYDILEEARRVLTSLQRDISQSLDAISSNAAFPGVVRRNSGWNFASTEPELGRVPLRSKLGLPVRDQLRVSARDQQGGPVRDQLKGVPESYELGVPVRDQQGGPVRDQLRGVPEGYELGLPEQAEPELESSSFDTQLRIVEACQARCLEYREMIRSIAESVLEKTKRFDSSSIKCLESYSESFDQLSANCSDFKEMCANNGVCGARALGDLSRDMTLFVQNLCLNTMQMQNDVYLERLRSGLALVRAHCKLLRVVGAACASFENRDCHSSSF